MISIPATMLHIIYAVHTIMVVEIILSLLVTLNIINRDKYIDRTIDFISWILDPIYSLVCSIFGVPKQFAPIVLIFVIMILNILIQSFR